jgi:hypothetical protein
MRDANGHNGFWKEIDDHAAKNAELSAAAGNPAHSTPHANNRAHLVRILNYYGQAEHDSRIITLSSSG